MDNTENNSNVYFAAKPADEVVVVLQSRSNDWFQTLQSNGYLAKLRAMWQAYYGDFYGDDSHQISFSGEQGEYVNLGINHTRNLAQHMLNMITSTRPAMKARATNGDYKSVIQARLANGLLDYYLREHRLEDYLKTAVEMSIVFGSGYLKLEWNATRGEVDEIDDVTGGTGGEIRAGEIEFSNLSPFDVMFDSSADKHSSDWVITRSKKNKYDLAAKFPELREKILQMPSINDALQYNMFESSFDETDLIPIYEFYHKRTEALPDGRYMLYLDLEVILLDFPMPYESLPVYRIAPSYYLGTNYGYSPMFDLLPIQDAVNSLYSTVFTNNTTFGTQSIVVNRNSDLDITSVEGGLQFLEVNDVNDIRPLQLTQSSPETYKLIEMLERLMETISGVNSVARGNPDPNLRSGNALALVQSMTLQFMSGLQQSYVAMMEDIGTGIIKTLQNHATVPRIAAIVGKNGIAQIKQFKGSDLDGITRVIVDIGNPLANTTAGRIEMAEQMMQMGIIKNPQHYFTVMNTGQLQTMTESLENQTLIVTDENERLVSNQPVVALLTDDHAFHIDEHSAILANSELRFDQEFVTRTMNHMQQHIDILSDPNVANFLLVRGQQPIPPNMPPMGPEGQPMPQDQGIPSGAMNGASQNVIGGSPVATAMSQQGGNPDINVPLPKVDPSLLSDGGTAQEAALGNTRKN